MGSSLSLPFGIFLKTQVFEFGAPDWMVPYYMGATFLSAIILPFWSAFALRSLPKLRRAGMFTFWMLFLLFLCGLLFPAI
jgi:uncharacterized membrane protein YecN with MAPEG domain